MLECKQDLICTLRPSQISPNHELSATSFQIILQYDFIWYNTHNSSSNDFLTNRCHVVVPNLTYFCSSFKNIKIKSPFEMLLTFDHERENN